MTDRYRHYNFPEALNGVKLRPDLLDVLIDLGVRKPAGVVHSLMRAGLTLSDVWEMTDEELISVRDFGVNKLRHVDSALGQLVLNTLGTKTTE